MQIAAQKVVTIEYTLKDSKGEVLDTSDGGEPLAYVHGAGNLIPGLEKELDGKKAGDVVDATIKPEDGYGVLDAKLIEKVPLRKLRGAKPEVGMRFQLQSQGGTHVVLVTAIEGDYATVDGNHPLAGMTLHFNVKVQGVRDATEEELNHGHVHGAGGHHH